MKAEAVSRVSVVFALFDANGNGELEADDFDLMAHRVVQAVPGADEAAKGALVDAFRGYWAALVGELDTDLDNKVSFEEFKAIVLAPERFDGALGAFADALADLGDVDGSGTVERPVFVALMTAIGFELPNIHKLFDAFGPDGDDRITVDTWAAGIRDYYSPHASGIPGDHLVPAAVA
ncbi:EF-hand domain-containing protein [Streptomyces sp. PT12]|uniref:EF-hand domain-containing protein n=1 Tax=Streptomyces sp. PT12 TaxID=1510197 RepID=UPI000DE29E71|nr:EF-hand domain-containing protein [Streptomyces sp. PT12]RBM22161.1 calcium-binding protein [Streptomyces sp. PT12]